MDLKTKTAQRIGDDFHAVTAELDVLSARIATLQADTRRALLLAPEASGFAERPVNRLGVAERLIGEAKLELQRSHKALAVGAERMDIGFQCPDGAIEEAPVAKRA